MSEEAGTVNPLRAIWQAQAAGPIDVDLDGIRKESERLDVSIRARNRRESLVAWPLAALFLLIAVVELVSGNGLSAAGALLVSASMPWIAFALRRWGAFRIEPADLASDGQTFLALFRDELSRQRTLLALAWLWYVLPVFAGLSLLDLRNALVRGQPIESWLTSVQFIFTGAIAAGVTLLNLVAARDLGRRLKSLSPGDER